MLEPITIQNFLSNEECKNIIDFSLNSLQLRQAKIGDGEEKLNKRNSEVSFYEYNEFSQLKEKIVNEIKNVLQIKGFQIEFSDFLQFTKYEINGHYDWHTDSDKINYPDRFCSIVIQLNDTYIGGELEILYNNETFIIPKSLGNLSIFLSDNFHRVTKVESGIRYSLVSWLSLKEQKNYKKTFL